VTYWEAVPPFRDGGTTMGDLEIANEERQLVVFELSNGNYGVDIGTVREINRMQTITSLPGTPDHILGVINLRGHVVPVVDLRRRFSLTVSDFTPASRIVVVDIGGRDIGVVVDGVDEVLRVPASALAPPVGVGASAEADYITNIVKLPERLIILLDMSAALSDAGAIELDALPAAA
jgi:purine-binding chemotaxis protein CheW